MKTLLLCLLATALLAAPASAPAIVAPKNCGIIEVKNKKHRIKADGVTCRFAKRNARRYLRYGTRPKGYTCKKFPAGSLYEFKCDKGNTRSIIGIKPR